MSLILGLGSQLVPAEAQVLSTLKAAAESGTYWDTLDRLRGSSPVIDIILQNIMTKARTAGLVSQLEALKKEMAAE